MLTANLMKINNSLNLHQDTDSFNKSQKASNYLLYALCDANNY